ncbi:MAG TPA: molybdopterin cofactor-binding domain-containing protein, partial [Burkholderiales bacterium]
MKIDRREFLRSAGALVVSFSIPLDVLAQAPAQARPNPKLQQLDAWLSVGGDGKVSVYTGKVELGTGVQTALAQLVADELDVPFERVHMVMGDTALCPNQGPTVGSQTMMRAGPQLRQAAAEARQTLLGLASSKLDAPVERLTVADGVVAAPGGKSVSYAELIGDKKFDHAMTGKAKT